MTTDFAAIRCAAELDSGDLCAVVGPHDTHEPDELSVQPDSEETR